MKPEAELLIYRIPKDPRLNRMGQGRRESGETMLKRWDLSCLLGVSHGLDSSQEKDVLVLAVGRG